MFNKLFFLISFCGITCVAVAQKYDLEKLSQLRNITVITPDSVIKAKVLDKVQKLKIQLEVDYYWYYNNQIARNKGGYSGKLLIGKYQVFTPKNLLITDGQFENGVMTGVWKYWNTNGNLKCLANFKNGKLHGIIDYYDIAGLPTRKIEYKNGLKQGKEYIYLSDTTIVNKYSNGKLVVKLPKRVKKDKTNVTSEKTGKRKENKTTASKNEREKLFPEDTTKSTVTQPKEHWWKRIFKSKKTQNGVPQESK